MKKDNQVNQRNRRNSGNRKPTRRENKPKDLKDKEYATEKRDDGSKDTYPLENDPDWYYDDKTLMDQVSSFSFNQFIGTSTAFSGSSALGSYVVPTCCRIYFNPCPGWSSVKDIGFSGINQADMRTYTMLSSGNSKNTLYVPQDVGTLMLALGEILSTAEVARRAIGMAFTYNRRNWAYPKEMIRFAGFDPDDLLKNLAQYRLWFNSVVNQINKISFPANFAYFQKCVNMYGHIYLDSESPMAQTYIFLPRSTWYIDETSYSGGTILKTVDLFDTDSTVQVMSQYLTDLETQINLVLTSATFNYIYADVLRLFGENGLYTVPYITEDYVVVPEYNPMMLLQINNLTVNPHPTGALDLSRGTTPDNDVYPDPNNNRLLYMPQFPYTTFETHGDLHKQDIIINFPHSLGDPDVTQRVECTRMMSRAVVETDSTGPIITDAALPDHYPTLVAYYGNTLTNRLAAERNTYYPYDTTNGAGYATIMDSVAKFDRAPRLHLVNQTNGLINTITGDLDYFTTIEYSYLDRVDDLTYVALFGVR